MRKKEKVEVPATTKTVHKVYCDLCGKELNEESTGWEQNEATIEARIGAIYPESDDRKYIGIDVCGDCFISKVKPVLEKELDLRFRECDVDLLWSDY